MAPVVRRAASPRFVGRGAELEALRAAFARAQAAQPTVVLVTGDAGIGKTRLVAELAADLPARVLVGACARIGEDGPPYGPLLPALRDIGALTAAPDEPEPGGLAGQTGRAWFFQTAVDRLAAESRHEPLVLVIEDLQWSDRSSRDLLDFITRCLGPSPLLVLVTVRTDELRRGDPVQAFLGELGRHERVERVELTGLEEPVAVELLGSLLDAAVPGADLAALARRADGNPYFLEELASASRRGERLPGSVRDIVQARVTGLPTEATSVLAAIAVLGRRSDEMLLRGLTGLQPGSLDAALRMLGERRLVDVDETAETWGFRHALVAEAVYADLAPAERRRLHLAAAGQARRRPADDAQATAEVAHHLLRAGAHRDGLVASIRAARAAERVYAYPEASRHWAHARSALERVSLDDRPPEADPLVLLECHADAAARAGDPVLAVQLEGQLLAALDAAGDRLAIAASRSRLASHRWDAGDDAQVVATSAAAVDDLADLPPSQVHAAVVARHARLLMLQSRLAEAAPIADRAVELARAHAPELEPATRITRGAIVAGLGRTEDGIAELHAGLHLARRERQPDEIARALLNLDYAYWSAGRLREALDLALEGVAEVRAMGLQSAFGGILLGNAAEKLFLLGDWQAAAARFAEAEVDRSIGMGGIDLRTSAAELAVARGDGAAAERLLRAAISLSGAVESGTTTVRLRLVEAELAIWQRRVPDALRALEAGSAALAPEDRATFLPRLAALAIRALAEQAIVDRATRAGDAAVAAARERGRALRETVEDLGHDATGGAASTAFTAMAIAEWTRLDGAPDPAAWARAAAAFDEIGSPYPAAYARFRQAEAALATRRPRVEVATLLGEVDAVTSRLDARPLAAELEALARRARIRPSSADPIPPQPAGLDHGLTPREREVVALVANGRTNRQIAEALFITEKTAGLHVSNILAKLAVGNRVEAAAAARRLGLLDDPGDGAA